MALDGHTHLYIADEGNQHIQVFDMRGHFLKDRGLAGINPHPVNQVVDPMGLVVLPSDKVYFVEFAANQILVHGGRKPTTIRSAPGRST